ncbi:excitatory amino acid transporter 3-like isoform X3 [Gambusia affinis]|uniref:excitatory amino acid transporter 3-like isoform X3 n=1 Tax=Gambusia affinis TaxID=33528 RepID=UPI001CDD49B4|nr:excitatory amino acid transporter 3-like isoform X3 [Gambusia affinis]
MRGNLLQVFCLLGVILGFGFGFLLRATTVITEKLREWMSTPGEVLLNMLKMFAVSLIVTSVLSGVTGLNTKMSRKTAIITGTFICGSTFIVVILAMVLTLTIQPGGEDHEVSSSEEELSNFVLHVMIQDFIRNMVPESFFQAFYEQYKTEIVQIKRKEPGLLLDPTQNVTETKLVGKYVERPNMLGLVIWSFVIGILLNRTGHEARSTVEAIHWINDAIKVMLNWVLWYLPIGVLFLIAEHVLDVPDWAAVLKLTKFVGVVAAGLAIQVLVIFPMIYVVLTKKNPFLIFMQISRALTTAFIIASSAAALPVTLQCCEEKVKIDKKLCRLMLPIVTGINRTGMTVYEVTATIFIAQLYDITLSVGQLIAIGLSSSIVSFGAGGIPATGAVTTILILTAVGLPAKHATILIALEWILAETTYSIKDIEMDLSCLDSDEELISSSPSSHSRSA